jgi:hypothetical protein|tara:strand:+ start:6484 stop:6870 length:387 start_codon:yes stop_codon:yes gene_type:complete
MANKSEMQTLEANGEISLEHVVLGWESLFYTLDENIISSIRLIDKPEYVALRTTVNDAFQVGEAPKFTGVVEEETEFGDVTDVLIIMLQNKYPPEKCADSANSIMLSVEQRKSWRDELIKELDEMVER